MKTKRLTEETVDRIRERLIDNEEFLYVEAPTYADALHKCYFDSDDIDEPTTSQFKRLCRVAYEFTPGFNYCGFRSQIVTRIIAYTTLEWDGHRRTMASNRDKFKDLPLRVIARKLIESGRPISVPGIMEVMALQKWNRDGVPQDKE